LTDLGVPELDMLFCTCEEDGVVERPGETADRVLVVS